MSLRCLKTRTVDASSSLAAFLLTLVLVFAGSPLWAAEPGAPGFPSVAPQTPWLPLPAPETVLTRIGVGSCLDEKHPEPIWKAVIASRPELFLMIGDNVYGDVKGAEMTELIESYRAQGRHPEFGPARRAFPFLPIWDDHDYGQNDSGADVPFANSSAALFYDFWQMTPERANGIYYAREFGPPGRRVQIIMLDARTFRSPLKLKTTDFPHWGRFEPDTTPGKTMLGEAQWTWLEAELRKPADVRLIISGIQVLAEGHGFERWGNLPLERDRLLTLIDTTKANGVVLLTGDRHIGAYYLGKTPAGRPLPEMTTSSLNRSYGPSKDARLPPLVTEIYHPENFGLVDIDWTARKLTLTLEGMSGEQIWSKPIALAELGAKD